MALFDGVQEDAEEHDRNGDADGIRDGGVVHDLAGGVRVVQEAAEALVAEQEVRRGDGAHERRGDGGDPVVLLLIEEVHGGDVLSAESVHYNNKEKIATIIFSDELSHGNIDGGHTYKIVCEHKGENLEQYVQFEVMTGVEDIIENLAEARNTSVQVDAKSMAELAEKFDPIKEGLEGMPFFKRIAFKQNQISVDDETGKKNKMIDAREIVAIISMFNISLYDALHHPTQAYSSKAKMLDMYLKNPEEYREYVNIMPDIFDLYDAVEMEFADAYNAGGGRYGRKKYAGYKDGKIVAKSKFGLNKMQYKVPDGLLYPVVAAFRSLLVKNKVTGKYEWKNGVGPIDVWDNNKEDLVNKIMNFAASIGDNPNAVGKDSNIWDLAYMTIMLRNMP